MDRSVYLSKDLMSGIPSLSHVVVRIGELLRYENIRILLLHSECGLKALLYALTDITVIMDQQDFRTIVADELAPFLTYGIRHYYYRPVSAHSADKCKTYSLVAAGRFDYHGIRADFACQFSLPDHIPRCTCLDRTAYVEAFEFYQHLSVTGLIHMIQADHRSVSDRLKDIIVYH